MNLPRDCHLTSDGSVVTARGDVLLFSLDRFRQDICEGNCCFVCGASPDATTFNDEHVVPEWMLRELNLFSKSIYLPNRSTVRYDRYKVPCCSRCNSLLGREIEQPVSNILKGGMDTLAEHLSTKGPWLLFVWLALLFVKTHLRDKAFRWHLDTRRGELAIAEVYDWEALHHIHCVARSFYSRAKFDASVMGTFFAFPASPLRFSEHFDYGDLYVPKAVCLRFRDAAMVCVLNDSCACFSLEKDRLFPRIKGPLSPLQIREVMARLAYLNLLIKERPHFYSEFDGGTYRIGAIHPHSIEVEKWDPEVYGQFLYLACADWLESCRNPEIEITKEHVRRGQYTFLFDQKGEFIRDQLIFLDKGEDAEQSR